VTYPSYGPLYNMPRDLLARRRELEGLSLMPERTTREDIMKTCQALQAASEAMSQLMKAELTGCICKRVLDNDRFYLDYDDTCPHHHSIMVRLADNKKHYEEAHKKLTDELRIKFLPGIIAALVTTRHTLDFDEDDDETVRLAFNLADAAIAELGRR